ncbi:MAG TPA: glycosyltransferase [Rudaea sp.]|jgi:glycosyltransferase involved in cell wall biosynthesis
MPTPTGHPLRLLLLTDTAILGAGGSQRFLRNLLTALPSSRYAIDVLQLSEAPDDARCVAQLQNNVVRLMYHPIESVYAPRGIEAYRMVRRRVLRGDYDIVQSHHEKSDLINALLPRVRGLGRISNRRDMGFQKTRRVRALFRRVNSRFDYIVAPCRSIIDMLVADENAGGKRCRTIPNGVDTTRFRPIDHDQRRALRSALGFENDHACLIGCVASFTPVKRHDVLVAAFAQVLARHSNAHLVLVGDGPLRQDIEARTSALGIAAGVHFAGARADVERILPALDLFVLASSTEGMSNAILEAQACGLPVIAGAVGGNTELVRPNVTGVLVMSGTVDAYAQALSDLVGDAPRRRRMGIAARDHAEQHGSVEAMAASYERLYRELMHAH